MFIANKLKTINLDQLKKSFCGLNLLLFFKFWNRPNRKFQLFQMNDFKDTQEYIWNSNFGILGKMCETLEATLHSCNRLMITS